VRLDIVELADDLVGRIFCLEQDVYTVVVCEDWKVSLLQRALYVMMNKVGPVVAIATPSP
jgi:hypothetical protein